MDKPSSMLDDPNMRSRTAPGLAGEAPNYALYGEAVDFFTSDFVHCEELAARSTLYGWRIGLHRHPSLFQILHIAAGEGTCLLAGAEVPITPPMLVTVPAGTVHGFAFSPDIKGRVITIIAERVDRLIEASQSLAASILTARAVSLAPEEAAEAAHGADAIGRECLGGALGRLTAIEAQLALLIVVFARALARTAGTFEAAPRFARHAAALRAAIERDFRTEHALAHYARALAVSPTHLNRIARAAYGTSALALLHRRIVNEAMRDLTFTAQPVKSIAYGLGFEDPAYFTRLFTRHVGRSPIAFRRSRAPG